MKHIVGSEIQILNSLESLIVLCFIKLSRQSVPHDVLYPLKYRLHKTLTSNAAL